MTDADVARIAAAVLAAGDAHAPIAPVTDSTDLSLEDAYRVSARITRTRVGRGEHPLGWKIGFTNITIWDEYGVHAPIWGPMYDTTLVNVRSEDGPATVVAGAFAEPRIEPEIALRIATPPHADMDETELMACVDAVAHGVEIVQSVFPGWRFQAADTVAAFALHGCYRCGPFVAVEAGERARWMEQLGSFEVTLACNGEEIDRGAASNVMGGGPLAALRALVRGLADYPVGVPLRSGDIVTTGTVTRAFPVQSGERWSTRLSGLPLEELDVTVE